jgi:predicted ester cyclase
MATWTPSMSCTRRRWHGPPDAGSLSFREAFPDVQMEIVDLVAEDDTVVARFRCSGTHLGSWRGTPATGRSFTNIDEVYFFGFAGEQISSA